MEVLLGRRLAGNALTTFIQREERAKSGGTAGKAFDWECSQTFIQREERAKDGGTAGKALDLECSHNIPLFSGKRGLRVEVLLGRRLTGNALTTFLPTMLLNIIGRHSFGLWDISTQK